MEEHSYLSQFIVGPYLTLPLFTIVLYFTLLFYRYLWMEHILRFSLFMVEAHTLLAFKVEAQFYFTSIYGESALLPYHY